MIEYTQSYNISLDRGAENKSITILVWQTLKNSQKGNFAEMEENQPFSFVGNIENIYITVIDYQWSAICGKENFYDIIYI